MRQYKDEEGCISTGLRKVRESNHVLGQGDAREILYVLMTRVDNVREVRHFALFFWIRYLFFIDPHVHLFFEVWKALTIATNKSCYCAAPISTSNDAYFIELLGAVLRIGIDIHFKLLDEIPVNLERLGLDVSAK